MQISKTSGLAGIAYWINEAYKLPPEKAYSKKDPLIVALKEWVDQEYEDGRQSVLSNQELAHKISELTGGELKWPGRNL